MSIKYNNKIIAGYYKTEIIPNADTVNAGKIRIATQAEVDSGESNSTAVTPSYLSKKQDKLTAGKNIIIENGVISADTTTGINVDGETISNENAVLSSIGTKTKSNTIKIDWEGTEAEYEAGLADGTISNDWYCYITDDETVVDFADHTELEVQNMYKTGNISTDTAGYNQLVEMKHSTFDLSKFTVVGTPTITDDGIASGFDNTANILFPIKNEDLVGKSWSISGACLQVASDIHKKIFAFGDNVEPSFGTIQYVPNINKVIFQFKTGDDTSSSSIKYIEVTLNETPYKIYFNLSFDRSSKTYTLRAKTDTSSQWQEANYIATTDNPDIYTLSQAPTQSLAIRAWANSTNPQNWTYPVDLKCYSVEINGKEVFSGNKTGLDVINEIEIPYTLSKTGSKIVDVAYRDRVIDLYEQEGQAGYYTIDEPNKNFTLPMGEIYGMIEKKASKKEVYNKITNCLLEVPQRIKYTLENGLTIKAGSVAIVPYGTEDKTADLPKGATFINENFKVYDTQFSDGKFFVWAELQEDKIGYLSGSFTRFQAFDMASTTGVYSWNTTTSCYSGSSAPTNIYSGSWWYDTTNNIIKRYNGSIWENNYISLPTCVFTTIDGSVTSIDQVFNGMGYIGSTIWADKGVKGLIPNGRNADGSLINEEVTTDKLYTLTHPWGTNSRLMGYELSDGTDIIPENHLIADMSSIVYEQRVMPTGTAWKWIDTTNNQVLYKDENNPSVILHNPYKLKNMFLGEFTSVDGKITSFTPKLPFRALDYSDKTKITNWSFPSDKYIDLTLGASGTTYTAPADGWVYYYASSTTKNTIHNAYCRLDQGGRPTVELRAQPRINLTTDTSKTSEVLCFLAPVIRGNFIIRYRGFNALEANNPYFRFYYAVGSEPLA